MWSPLGIGGDDRCGVFIILNLVFKGYRPHIAFTWNEEIGCVGAQQLITDIDFIPVNFAIQFDRKGSGESVYYDLYDPEFEDYINNYGFKTAIGSYSDISVICPSWDMAGVNLSAGYMREHTFSEAIYLEVLYDTLQKASWILEDQQDNPTYFKYTERSASHAEVCPYCKTTNELCQYCYYKSWRYEDEYNYY
jgi:hypothetical protein